MKNLITTIAFTILLATVASAANVDARISAREAYVGAPVTLQISISDAADYEQPALPAIDGCDVRSAGAPSQSSQITIINGRRSQSRSVTMQYLITPRREGTFTVPTMKLKVDGRTVTTEPQRFVATKSETGDLMYVEIEGGKKSVFVGQPLDLTLKIWIKPYRDLGSGQTLSEADMWNMISDSTSWGGFSARMKELAENNQRPGGHEVLRDNGHGSERGYYLYEINATVYPKRAGKIDSDDVQIVVNYPTALGKSRSPFGSFFGDSMFGGNSPMSRLMDDDFFSSSFGNRMAVTDSRPIVGTVSVDATEVLPVPMEGRPDDYRGAVGRYQIVTQATPTTIDAGDPITLNIGIAGTGPMELVQAPPLYELPELTMEFKVADESLAGFVKDDTKVFSTTIRPRHEGVTEIPPIRFSFFDPETEKYVTVMSDPISIKVNKAESLALDAIVGNSHGSTTDLSGITTDASRPDFTNHSGSSLLMNQSPSEPSRWWWVFVVLPPLAWITVVINQHRDSILNQALCFKSPKSRCLAAIERACDADQIADAVTTFIFRRSGIQSNVLGMEERKERANSMAQAIGSLRLASLYQVACEAETFLSNAHVGSKHSLKSLATKAKDLVEMIDAAMVANKKSRVKPVRSASATVALHRPIGMLLAAAFSIGVSSSPLKAQEPRSFVLSATQQETLLDEATQSYNRAITSLQTDTAEAKEQLTTALGKYQLLVDSGVRNAQLYANLGNAYLQSGKLGNAIASYERALDLDPGNDQVIKNLTFANGKVQGVPSLTSKVTSFRGWNDALVGFVGKSWMVGILVTSSLVFWGLLILRVVDRRLPVWKCAAIPFAILGSSLVSVVLTESNPPTPWNAVVVAENVSLHAGDGDQFDEVISIDAAQGHRVEVLAHRGKWSQILTSEGHRGWVHDRDLEVVRSA